MEARMMLDELLSILNKAWATQGNLKVMVLDESEASDLVLEPIVEVRNEYNCIALIIK